MTAAAEEVEARAEHAQRLKIEKTVAVAVIVTVTKANKISHHGTIPSPRPLPQGSMEWGQLAPLPSRGHCCRQRQIGPSSAASTR
jgi:hypothetical protein